MAVLDRRSFVISERTLVPGHFNALLASPTKIDKAWDHTAAVSQTLREHSTPASHLTGIITRDPNKDLDNNVAHSGRKRTLRSIRTLDPSKLSRHDYLDFSGIGPSCAYVAVPPGARIPDAAVKTSPFTYIRLFPRGWRSHTFPTNAKGFLYYYKPPHSPPMAGQIRFRCMQSDSPQDFASGYDLCGDNGLPWSVPLVLCGHTACYAPILDVALRDGLISHKLVDLMQKTPTPRKLPVADRLVYTLGQPFALRMGAAVGPTISFLGKDRFIADVLTTISGSPSKRKPLYQAQDPRPLALRELALLELSFFARWLVHTTSFTVLPNGDHQLLSSAIRSPPLRASVPSPLATPPGSSLRPLVVPPALRGLLRGDPLTASSPTRPPARPHHTPSLLLGPARPPSMNPLAITPPWARAPVPAPVWVQSLPFGPILTLSLPSLRLSASLSFLA
ncbi:hypothetical protein DICSQDRAFT_171179 [Dichomitus squalens LYAD-421 SS1]|uniref:Uncharacterized protein n=1 Tax=Dichomitus squalens (strain LYAD-421) TaxID=732165 RepID=R7SWX3_DICSQ|nr:uncharacterized protein DICSQDRAFT_171179 [Dichomitus squalens LYAD-421 SS1]EJF60468.1 hypothetical protein DICSQDRAFT_171179 [Dichomitus squalens LYAD-421 SS1]